MAEVFEGDVVEHVQSCDEGYEEGWEDSSDAALVESGNGECSGFDLFEYDRRDEEFGYHEEYVNTCEAAAESGNVGMEEEYGKYGYRSQAIDVGSIG